MKEVRFRVWYEQGGYMMPVETIDFKHKLINEGGVWRWFHEVDLMQYTGLKDKNGVEIYEGDIYRYEYYTGSGVEYRNSVVEWETTEVAHEGVFHGYELNNYEIEVIGNIYENQELVK